MAATGEWRAIAGSTVRDRRHVFDGLAAAVSELEAISSAAGVLPRRDAFIAE